MRKTPVEKGIFHRSFFMRDAEYETLVEVAHALADAARTPILRHFRSEDLAADNKLAGGFDPVTIADRESEMAMRAVLARLRPDDGFLAKSTRRQPVQRA